MKKARTAKECREALYDAFEHAETIELDVHESVDPDEIPVSVLECEECRGRKTIVYIGTYPIPCQCGRCGADLLVNDIVAMVIQGNKVLYREGI